MTDGFDDEELYHYLTQVASANWDNRCFAIWENRQDLAADLFMFIKDKHVYDDWDKTKSSWTTYVATRCRFEVHRILMRDIRRRESKNCEDARVRVSSREWSVDPNLLLGCEPEGEKHKFLWNIIVNEGHCIANLRCMKAGWTSSEYEVVRWELERWAEDKLRENPTNHVPKPESRPWEIDDNTWNLIRRAVKKADGTRKRSYESQKMGDRDVLGAVFYILRNQLKWYDGAEITKIKSATLRKWYLRWKNAGLFEKLAQKGLELPLKTVRFNRSRQKSTEGEKNDGR
jgi:hypothetical protein